MVMEIQEELVLVLVMIKVLAVVVELVPLVGMDQRVQVVQVEMD